MNFALKSITNWIYIGLKSKNKNNFDQFVEQNRNLSRSKRTLSKYSPMHVDADKDRNINGCGIWKIWFHFVSHVNLF